MINLVQIATLWSRTAKAAPVSTEKPFENRTRPSQKGEKVEPAEARRDAATKPSRHKPEGMGDDIDLTI